MISLGEIQPSLYYILFIESHMLNESTLAKLETYLEQQEVVTGEASDSELISEPERMRSYGNTTKRKCSSLPASPQHRGSFSEKTPSLDVKKVSSNPHCTTYMYSYLLPLYSKQCLIGTCWSPIIPFFLC